MSLAVSTEGCCDEALSYLCEVLEQPEFPHSYSIEFRGPEKIYLPIPGLPNVPSADKTDVDENGTITGLF